MESFQIPKMGSKFKLALIQLSVGANKSDNLIRAANKISEAVEKGANIVSLPGSRDWCSYFHIILNLSLDKILVNSYMTTFKLRVTFHCHKYEKNLWALIFKVFIWHQF